MRTWGNQDSSRQEEVGIRDRHFRQTEKKNEGNEGSETGPYKGRRGGSSLVNIHEAKKKEETALTHRGKRESSRRSSTSWHGLDAEKKVLKKKCKGPRAGDTTRKRKRK